MRIRNAVAVLLIAVITSTTGSVTGQEEPLPAVTPRALAVAQYPDIILAVEPIREIQQPTLAEAARRNDFATFDALYRQARERGQAAEFRTLHELWTYAVTDPIGAFYGVELYQRFARAYPGYAEYIADYRIVDDRGNTYYPTSETRAFLLDRALEGRTPRVLVAEQSSPRSTETVDATATRAVQTPARVREPALDNGGLRARRSTASDVRTAPAVEKSPVVETAPVAAQPEPVAVAEVAVPETQPEPAPATPPVTIPQTVAEQQAPAAPAPQPQSSRGLFLLVLGLLGVGLLALMMRTPRESQPMSIITPAVPEKAEKPPAPVEPLRRPAAADKTQQTRKTGS